MVDPLPTQDAVLWWVQDPSAPLWTGAVAVFDGAPLRVGHARGRGSSRRRAPVDIDALRRHLEAALDAHPRFRQRIVGLPLGQGVAWVDEDGFSVEGHVHLVVLPAPGGDAEVGELVDGLLERPLAAERSPWDIWVVDGLRGGRVALIIQVNHVLADGTALVELALSLLSFSPGEDAPAVAGPVAGRAAAPARPPAPTRSPAPPALLMTAAAARTRNRFTALGRLAATLVDPRTVGSAARAVVRLGREGPPIAPATSLSRPVGRRRHLVRSTLPWERLAAVGHAHGATLNDVLAAVLAGAVARHLERDGRPLTGRPPRVLVPVSGRRPGQPTANTFGFFVIDLPVAEPDPVRRLRRIHVEMDRRKRSPQDELTRLVFSIADFVPLPLLRAVVPAALRRQPFANLVLTDMPGSPEPLYLLGARMLSAHPFVCGIGNMAVVVGVLSYGADLGVGITVDADVVPDAEAFAADVEAAAAELLAAAPVASRSG